MAKFMKAQIFFTFAHYVGSIPPQQPPNLAFHKRLGIFTYMNLFFKIFAYLLALLFILGATGHIFTPQVSDGFIPDALPKPLVHGCAALIEIGIGISLLLEKYRTRGAQAAFLLLLGFLPLHIMDLFNEQPVIGSHTAAIVRVVVQVLFLLMAWVVFRKRPSPVR
jgi:uncharacterized membrane protein